MPLTGCDSSPAGTGGSAGSAGISGAAGSAGNAQAPKITIPSTTRIVIQSPNGGSSGTTSGSGGTSGSGSTPSNPTGGTAGSPIAQCIPDHPTGTPTNTCGDGFRSPNEACDDGNTLPNDGCSPTCQVTPQLVSPRVPILGRPMRINSGGPEAGSYSADQFVNGGTTFTSDHAITTSGVANAAPESVYQSERVGDFSYALSGLSPGIAYTVRLHFAEFWVESVGNRVFNVAINGVPVLENFDIISSAGGANKAVVREFSPIANGVGQIVVSFAGVVDNAKLSGLELIPPTSHGQGPIAAQPILRVNCGGAVAGSFSADEFFTGGNTYANENPIATSGVANAGPAELYQSERYGNFSYTLNGLTPAATYIVRLHFTENYFASAGSRVFNVAINGAPVLEYFDIYAEAGANKAVVHDFSAVASEQGRIVVGFSNVVDDAKLSGLELLMVVENHKALPSRSIGAARHPLAAGCNQVAVAFADHTGELPALFLSTFSTSGVPRVTVPLANVNVSAPNPGVAALPGDEFVAAWTDFDDDELGVHLRKIVPGASSQSAAVVANEDSAFSQSEPDIVFDGRELVVAWVDPHDPVTRPDLRYRVFAPDLTPLSGDEILAATGAVEDNVVLAGHNGHWAAAWRAGAQGRETIEVQSGGVHWTVGPFLPGATDDRPDLIFLDETHLAVAFTMGTDPENTGQANVPRLHAAVLDPATPGATQSFALAPAHERYAFRPSIGQSEPSLVLAADHLLVAWRSGALPGDIQGAELWSRRVPFSVSGNSVTLDPSHIEEPLVQKLALRAGDQDAFRMVGSTLWPDGGTVSVWDDSSRSFGAISGGTDVALQFLPDSAGVPDARVVPFELSADGHYYNVNVLRRGPSFPQPTATATYAGGAWQYIRPPSAAFDGDDTPAAFGGGVANTWAENPNASSTIVIDMGRVLSIGAIRPIYGETARAPNSMQFRVAETPGQWVTAVPPYFTDRTMVANQLALTHEFPAIRARYLELTLTGTSSFGGVALQELLVFPSAAQDPPPTTLDGYDVTYLSGVTHSQNANARSVNAVLSGPRTLFDKNFVSHVLGKTLAEGANGDAIVTIDLGNWFAISQVSLMYYSGYNWLLGGRIEVASDPALWVNVVDSGRGNPLGTADGPQTFTFTRQTARYIRLTSYFVPGVGLNVAGWNMPPLTEVQVF